MHRVEILTATKAGLGAFLLDLKRAQVRTSPNYALDSKGFKEFAAALKKKRPEYRKKADAEVYAVFIDRAVEVWMEQRRESITKQWEASRAENLKKFGTVFGEGLDGRSAERQEAILSSLHSIQAYIGSLNRDLNANRVNEYLNTMMGGNWWFTPDPVVVTLDGYIINGQHRLAAAEQFAAEDSESAPQFVVVWGVDKRAAILMDESRRSATDRRDIAMRYAASVSA